MSQLTIAQGLRRVKKCKGRMAELTMRAAGSVSYDVKSKPVFEFKPTCDQIAVVREELVTLEAAVATANATAKVSFEGKEFNLAEAIRRLQEFKAEIAFLQGLRIQDGTVVRDDGYDWDENRQRQVPRRLEITFQTDLKETERVARIEALRERFDRLNDAVETANHRTTIPWKDPGAPSAEATSTATA